MKIDWCVRIWLSVKSVVLILNMGEVLGSLNMTCQTLTFWQLVDMWTMTVSMYFSYCVCVQMSFYVIFVCLVWFQMCNNDGASNSDYNAEIEWLFIWALMIHGFLCLRRTNSSYEYSSDTNLLHHLNQPGTIHDITDCWQYNLLYKRRLFPSVSVIVSEFRHIDWLPIQFHPNAHLM